MKLKLALKYPLWKLGSSKVKRMNKKAKKDPEKYDTQWKFDYTLRRVKKLLKTFKIVVKIEGYKNLPKGVALLTPNHQSNVDPLLIMYALKKQTHDVDVNNKMCIFIAKEELKKNKMFKNWADFLETLYIDRNNPKTALIAFDQIAKKAKLQNKYIVIFPEGTRSKDGKVHEFKPGVFRIPKKEFIPIVPVTINNSSSFSNLSRKGTLNITVIFHRPIKPSTFMTKETKFIAKKVQKIVESSWVKPDSINKGKSVINA